MTAYKPFFPLPTWSPVKKKKRGLRFATWTIFFPHSTFLPIISAHKSSISQNCIWNYRSSYHSLKRTAESRDRTYDHSAYGHHERPGSSFERQRHYEADYYRDARDRTLSSAGSGSGSSSGSGTAVSSGVVGTIGSAAAGVAGASAGATAGGSAGSTSSGVAFYRSHSRSPCRFETAESRYESRGREPFTLASVVHRDLYRDERGRRGERSYRHSRSRSPHSTHSRNPSPQRLASQATRPPHSRSGSGSRTRSSSSDSVSSTSSSTSGSDSSSSSSDDSPARSVQSAAVPAPSALPLSSLDKDEPRKSFGIKVQNLPVRSTDTSLKDGLFHEFKKHGKVTSVQIHGASEERYGLVFFRQQEDQEKALAASKGKLFFGMQIDVTAWNGPETESENEFRPLDERIDEFHPKATRTLFIGNLEKTTTYHDLLNIFQRFGEIVDIDIKKVNGAPQYAFLQYCDIASVCKAIKKMDGEYLGNNRLKLGFGKSMPTTCVWLDGLASNTTEQFLTRHFCRYGHVVKVVFDRMKGMALILYNNIEYAQAAVKDTKGWKIGGSKIKVDFANQESQMAFYRSMQASGQDIRDFYDIVSERSREDRRTPYEFPAERQYYENVRTPGTYTEDPRRKYTPRSREFYTEWDPYQGDYYDTQYFEDPREYREYRADPYEQDIRKYSYLQRERERERERFETDRGRDHSRRTIERSQSPSHITARRPASPTASPALSERIPSDSDRRICCRSSDRSGSCSSISPPRFEKPDKTRPERYNKTEKPEKDRVFEMERGSLVENEKRGRKDRGEKEKSEKRLKKLKSGSPGLQICEAEPELDTDTSPDSAIRNKNSKIQKESLSKGRLDLLPCVVQLTRVKEKEGKLFGHAVEKTRSGNESPRLASPTTEQRSPPFRSEPPKADSSKHGKTREKNMSSLVEIIDKDVRNKSKKHGKSEVGFDIAVDMDRLAARKRRFEDNGMMDRQKRISEDDPNKSGFHKPWNNAKETESILMKVTHKKENHKDKCIRMASDSPNDILENESLMGLSLERQSQHGEHPEDPVHGQDSPHLKLECQSSKCESLTKNSNDGILYVDELKEQKHSISEKEHSRGTWRDLQDGDESLNDKSSIASKQTEQTQWFSQKLTNPERLGKFENVQIIDIDNENDCFVSDGGKTIQNMAEDDVFTCKRNKSDHYEYVMANKKREQNFECSQRLNEDIFITSPTGTGLYPANEEDETAQISFSVINKKRKSPPTTDDKYSYSESLKSNFGHSARHFLNTDTELSKLKSTLLGCDEELMQHWERRIKPDTVRMEMTFTSDMAKRSGIQKRLGQDLEPGEVQSDSDDDSDTKRLSPRANSSLSFILRERDERMTDLKLSGSLERNKFYSFALDKTITPDTKALLERAKTLYSTREDNWSFLPSRFPTSHSCSDKNKVELAPRPIPSWYMKKKKIRTDSDEKMHNKKEEVKPQDQERQELFASRFLHSSIFEQDSRRLQRLERKDQDVQSGVSKSLKPGCTELQPESAGGNTPQEPIVLFHSRFLELQQQKDKDSPSSENETVVVDFKRDEVQNCDSVVSEKLSESVVKTEDKSASPQLTLTLSTSVPFNKESPSEPKESSTEQPVLKIEKIDTILEEPPPLPFLKFKILPPKLSVSPPTVDSEPQSEVETKLELKETKVQIEPLLAEENREAEKPPTPCGSLNSFEKHTTEVTNSDYPKTELKMEPITLEKQETKQNTEGSPKTVTDMEVCMPELDSEIKPVMSRRQPKSKRSKPLSALRTSQVLQTAASEKPATRKSERIDKEKLKRALSPRADVPKTSDSKTTSKSPIHASDSEQNLESSLIYGRTRRRNVRSVYATLHEGDQVGKEVVEPSRLTRKRGADKDLTQQEVNIPAPVARRGRPPKRVIKRNEDASPRKVDQKMMEDNTEVKETIVEAVKVSESWRSPRTQKVQTATTALNRKGGKTDTVKQSSNHTVSTDQTDTLNDDSELKRNVSDNLAKQLDKIENATVLVHRKEQGSKESGGKKMEESDVENIDTSLCEKGQPEKSVKIKMPRVKKNIKLVSEDKAHSLKNLEIRVSVDDVKGLLRSEDDEHESFQTPVPKAKTVIQEKEESKIKESKDSQDLNLQDKEETLSEPEFPADPAAALLARQMELEQAVENIAKLAVEQPTRPYKEPATETPTILPPVTVEPGGEAEEEKRANPASETELAAAIDSITAEETCADTDGFTASSTYTALIPTPDSVISPSSNEIMEPETHMVINNIISADSDDGCLTPSPKGPMSESKTAEVHPLLETSKKTGKVRAKTPKKPRGRKGVANKRGDLADEVIQLQSSPPKLPESIPEDPETLNSKAITVTAGTSGATSVVTAVATCRRDVMSAITVNTPKEAEQPEVEQPVPKESAFHSGTFNMSPFKKHPQLTEQSNPTTSPDADSLQPVPQHNVPVQRPANWAAKSVESRIYVVPPCHVTVVTPTITSSAALGTTTTNPPMPPDTKASDIDPSSSTLRKILMEPKYVSASNSTAVTTIVTSVLSDPVRMSENEKPTDTVRSRQLHSEERPLPPQTIHHKPSPLTESQQNYGEKPPHTIIPSPTTSVISRIPLPYDTEETPRISLSNRSIGLAMPKQKFRSNSNENNRYHCIDVVEDGNRGRSHTEPNSYSTASGPGLRVNTSEGVVVLSYSGPKTEGAHRLRAKISQIPPASAGDIEFQQSVSKSQIKQETLIPSSQTPSPKVAPTSSAYGHTSVLLSGQAYNNQNVITTTKQDSLEKSESPYHTSSQGGVVKMFQQPVSSPQVLMYNQPVIQQHGKRALVNEPLVKRMDSSKGVQLSTLSPVMSPPHPSLTGTRMSPSPGMQTDRSTLHLNQEPQSPRAAVHSPSPYGKAYPPSSSPIGTSVVMGHTISTYHSTIHHTHSEQSSVIIQPHSVTQSLAHEGRINTTQVSGINYGRRSDSHLAPHSGPPQRSNTPQSNVIRDVVLQSHSSPQGPVSSGVVSGAGEDESRHFNQALSRPSVSQHQPDVMIMHSEHRALHPGIRMDQYRDMHHRILMHQQLGEQTSTEVRHPRTADNGTPPTSNISRPLKSTIVSKGIDLSAKEPVKSLEGKLIQPPSSESRIRGVHVSSPVMVSPHPHGVQLIHPGAPGSFSVYRDIRGFPSQFPGHSSSGHSLPPSQVPLEQELGHRGKMSHSHGGGSDSKPDTSHLRHATSTEYSHMSRIPGDTVSPAYQSPMSSPMTSPMGLNHKQEVSLQKGHPTFLPTPSPTMAPSLLQPRHDAKLEHTGHRSIDMVQLLTKYPIVWQGLLALKNDQAAVQLHFVSGNTILAQRSLPPPEGGPLLRIVQRMRLEASQLDSVARRMTVENDYCLLLALPCGRDQEDVLGQTHALKSGFITYLQAKQAAGIINVPNPGSNQPAYVVQIFPPCEFSESHLSRLAPDLLNSISSISPHLMIVIASV